MSKKKNLVMLHGWGMHGGIWGECASILAQEFELHCLDLPGYGGTPPPAQGSLEGLAAALLPALPERFTLLGWSLGGMLALHLAATVPQRVEKLVLLAGTPRFCQCPGWPDAMPGKILDAFESQMQGDAGATLNRFLAIQSLGGDDARAQVALMKRLLAQKPLPEERTLKAGLAILRNGDVRPLLSAIRQPVCLIQGEMDTVVPPGAARALAAILPQAELHLLPGCAHTPFLSQPQEVAGIIREFVFGSEEGRESRVESREGSVESPSCEPRARKLPLSTLHSPLSTSNPIRRAFDAAAGSYDASAEIQREVARRLVGRLDGATLPAHRPLRVLDAGSGTGYGEKLLAARLPDMEMLELDIAHAMLSLAREKRKPRHCHGVCADLECLPLAGDSMDLVFSSLALQWAREADAAFSEFRRCLVPGGLLHFSTLAPGTLRELAQAFAGVDGYRHVNRFRTADEVREALERGGFVQVSMEQECLVAEYRDLAGVLRGLKGIGARRVVEEGVPGLMGKERWRQATANYESLRANDRLPASYEVLYVSARKPFIPQP